MQGWFQSPDSKRDRKRGSERERERERGREKKRGFFKIKAYISMAKIVMEALYSQENDKAGQAITLW